MFSPSSAGKSTMAAIMAGLLLCGILAPDLSRADTVTDSPVPGLQNSLPTSEETGFLPTKQDSRLTAYEAAISSGDPVAANNFLKDTDLINALAVTDPQKEASLKATAEALKDLKELLAMNWDDAKTNSLNKALTIRMDAVSPLSKVGVGPEPEKLLSWLAKYQPQYPKDKTEILKKAIRKWEVVFGTTTDTISVQWNPTVNVTKTEWRTLTLKERNAVITKIIDNELRTSDPDPKLLGYDDAKLAEVKKQISLAKAVEKTMNSGALTPEQLAKLSGKSLSDKVYLLGNFFDGSNISVSPELKAQISAARSSRPKEVLPSQQREILGTMLNTAVSKELAGTQAGKKVLAFYSKEAKLDIAVRPCDGTYSRYDSASGKILLDSETIQQYMRMKGYTADSLMKSKEQVAEIAKYMAPAVAYESAHQMQDIWGKKQGIYNPRAQESEIEAMSLEGIYTAEKIRKDPASKEIFATSRDFSSYASKNIAVSTKYEKSGSKAFATAVRQLYCPGLPSLSATAAQTLDAVTGELNRRAALTDVERASIDSTSRNMTEAMEMSSAELSGSVGEIQTSVLAKIQRDLSSLDAYKNRYGAADKEGRKALKSLETGMAPKSGAPPAL